MTRLPWMMCPPLCASKNHNRKLTVQKENGSDEQRQEQTKREALLQQANALLADMADAPVKKNKKNKIEDE